MRDSEIYQLAEFIAEEYKEQQELDKIDRDIRKASIVFGTIMAVCITIIAMIIVSINQY